MKDLLLHDSTLINVIINPLHRFCQLIISTELEKTMIIEIDNIKKISQTSLECLSMFFNGDGNIDYCSLDKDGEDYVLSMRGLINPYDQNYSMMSWDFTVFAENILISEKKCSEYEIEKLISTKSINLFENK